MSKLKICGVLILTAFVMGAAYAAPGRSEAVAVAAAILAAAAHISAVAVVHISAAAVVHISAAAAAHISGAAPVLAAHLASVADPRYRALRRDPVTADSVRSRRAATDPPAADRR